MSWYWELIFVAGAISGAIICCIVMCNARVATKWNSELGRWAIVGVLLLLLGLLGWLTHISKQDSEDEAWWNSTSNRVYAVYTPPPAISYNVCIKSNGHLGWGMGINGWPITCN